MSSVSIRFNKATYVTGEMIEGQAVCQFRSPKQFRKIKLRFKCKEHTQYSKTKARYNSLSGKTEFRPVKFTGDNIILFQEINLLEQGELPSGEHVFPFSFYIPHGFPSSFHRKNGDITYSFKLIVDRAFKFDIEDKKIVNVISLIRFHDISQILLSPLTLSDENTICCWCCSGGSIEVQLEFDNRVFTQGKAKSIRVSCSNMSNKNIEEISLKIKQKIKFITTSPSQNSKEISDTIYKTQTSGVGAHGDKTCFLIVTIPDNVDVPNFSVSRLFEVYYELKLKAVVSGCHKDLEIVTEVGITNVLHPADAPQRTFENDAINNATDYPPMPMPMVNAPVIGMPMPAEGYGLPSYSDSAYPPEQPGPLAPCNREPSAPSGPEYAQLLSNELPPPSYNQAVGN
ncbi:arrestin domain-containing protein 3-like [Anthonomus grandis grandis]|uniref:arrestin domain-containing protein 3-like n=1 Tax=Anthonomus grandis grandis TaxID=2921223 RepID=UPI002165C721|nr:arrestin domain-containing protein 3-like [Anthonomus grandis grandis]XP_050299360.1 arrestin domain-containing protein 3-like [Anthonomus grandis grandis]XP_050299364.1 arrestin domain-containing protein 3-like [Anthonomus grandis grandis]